MKDVVDVLSRVLDIVDDIPCGASIYDGSTACNCEVCIARRKIEPLLEGLTKGLKDIGYGELSVNIDP